MNSFHDQKLKNGKGTTKIGGTKKEGIKNRNTEKRNLKTRGTNSQIWFFLKIFSECIRTMYEAGNSKGLVVV